MKLSGQNKNPDMNKTLYLATREGGYLAYADLIAEPGALISSLPSPGVFERRYLTVANDPSCFSWSLTGELWEVEAVEAGPPCRYKGVAYLTQARVIRQVDTFIIFGASQARLTKLFDALRTLRVNSFDADYLDLQERWYKANPDCDDEDLEPLSPVLDRATKVMDVSDAQRARYAASDYAKRIAERAYGQLFSPGRGPSHNAYEAIKNRIDSALFYAVNALMTKDSISAEDFDLLITDLRGVCGIDVSEF
jgi:hypothetical protein